jgi:hypothetical protein
VYWKPVSTPEAWLRLLKSFLEVRILYYNSSISSNSRVRLLWLFFWGIIYVSTKITLDSGVVLIYY